MVTPPARRHHAAPERASSSKGETAAKAKKTFARRYRPASVGGAALWDAMLAAFTSVVTLQLEPPHSKLEATFWSFATSKWADEETDISQLCQAQLDKLAHQAAVCFVAEQTAA